MIALTEVLIFDIGKANMDQQQTDDLIVRVAEPKVIKCSARPVLSCTHKVHGWEKLALEIWDRNI